MKRGVSYIELIFVIVILGVIAAVSVPRLAGSKSDADISAALANVRTLKSDVKAYHAVAGNFDNSTKDGKISWSQLTSASLYNQDGKPVGQNDKITTPAIIKAGSASCLEVSVAEAASGVLSGTSAELAFRDISIDPVCSQITGSSIVASNLIGNTNQPIKSATAVADNGEMITTTSSHGLFWIFFIGFMSLFLVLLIGVTFGRK